MLEQDTHGNGIIIFMSCSTISAASSSYSMLTSHFPSPRGEGQQLTARALALSLEVCRYVLLIGTKDSSLVVNRHRNTPTPWLTGKPRSGFFNAITRSSPAAPGPNLPTLGCCWNCKSLAVAGEDTIEVIREGAGAKCSRRWDSAGSRIRKSRSPRRSNDARPPLSRRRERDRRSRMVTWTLQARRERE
jgi:hypothetical protein